MESKGRSNSVLVAPSESGDTEINPWQSAAHRFDEAAELLGLEDGMRKVLRQPAMELTVNIPVVLDDGRIEVFTGYRVQHSIARGPAKGVNYLYGDSHIQNLLVVEGTSQ